VVGRNPNNRTWIDFWAVKLNELTKPQVNIQPTGSFKMAAYRFENALMELDAFSPVV
jgi:hypothetical protein